MNKINIILVCNIKISVTLGMNSFWMCLNRKRLFFFLMEFIMLVLKTSCYSWYNPVVTPDFWNSDEGLKFIF